MYKKIAYLTLPAIIIPMAFCGCFKGDRLPQQDPFITIYNVPPDSSTMGAAPVIWWWGTDRDGRILGYKYIDIPRSKFGDYSVYYEYRHYLREIPDTGVSLLDGRFARWFTTTSNVDTIYLSLEYGEDTTEHLFCVKSFDNDSDYSDVECRIFFRTNQPPDSVILRDFENYPENDTFWILKDFTDDWEGIPFSWRGHDADNSVILEYYWWVQDRNNPSIVVRASIADDSLGGVFCGEDSTDGWVRSTNTVIRDIPTGDWKFIIKIRDDAFYEGDHDTFAFCSAWPYFDPSIPETLQSMHDGTFAHKILMIYANSPAYLWNADMQSFYEGVFSRIGMADDMIDYIVGLAAPSGTNLKLTISKNTMKDYSMIYCYVPNKKVCSSPSASQYYLHLDALDDLRDYAMAGGRVIFEGPDPFLQISEFSDQFSPYGQIPYDMFGISKHAGQPGYLVWADAVYSGYGDLSIDPAKLYSATGNPSLYLGFERGISPYPYFFGVPYVEVLFRGGDYDSIFMANDTFMDTVGVQTRENLIGWPIACRFAKRTTRSACFAFSLYAMQNDAGQVDSVLSTTFNFILGAFEPDTTEEEGLLRFWQ